MNKQDLQIIAENTYKDFLIFMETGTGLGDVVKYKVSQFSNRIDWEHFVDHCRKTMAKKQKEYATDADTLHNFRVGAQLTGQSMADVARGFQLKHVISILDLDKDKDYPLTLLYEKFGDWLNYQVLISACEWEGVTE